MTQDLILKAELQPTPEMQQLLATGGGIVEEARALIIDSPDMAEVAAEDMRSVKARAKRLKELRDLFVAPAKQIIETADGIFKPQITALVEAEGVYKGKLMAWTTEQERIAAEARRKAEAEARALREAAERQAAAERAKAEAEAAEKRRQAEAAAAAQRKAEEEGNARAAKAAAAKAAALAEEARQVTDNAEAKVAELTMTAAAAAPVAIAQAAKPSGFSARKNWVAELDDGVDETRAVVLIAQAITGGRADLIGLLKLDLSAASRLAKAQEQHMSVPGLRAVNRPIAASRAA